MRVLEVARLEGLKNDSVIGGLNRFVTKPELVRLAPYHCINLGNRMSTANPQESESTEIAPPDLTPTPLRLKKILVPTDFSDESYNALRQALELARQFSSDVLLIHVVEPIHPYPVTGLSSYPIDLPPDPIFEMRGEAGKLLEQLKLEAKTKTSIPVETVLRVGRAYDQIIQVARDSEVDLIVISTHGYTGLKHVLLGSTAERVVRHAPCPVMVVRAREGGASK